jgi:hypothetical protein
MIVRLIAMVLSPRFCFWAVDMIINVVAVSTHVCMYAMYGMCVCARIIQCNVRVCPACWAGLRLGALPTVGCDPVDLMITVQHPSIKSKKK